MKEQLKRYPGYFIALLSCLVGFGISLALIITGYATIYSYIGVVIFPFGEGIVAMKLNDERRFQEDPVLNVTKKKRRPKSIWTRASAFLDASLGAGFYFLWLFDPTFGKIFFLLLLMICIEMLLTYRAWRAERKDNSEKFDFEKTKIKDPKRARLIFIVHWAWLSFLFTALYCVIVWSVYHIVRQGSIFQNGFPSEDLFKAIFTVIILVYQIVHQKKRGEFARFRKNIVLWSSVTLLALSVLGFFGYTQVYVPFSIRYYYAQTYHFQLPEENKLLSQKQSEAGWTTLSVYQLSAPYTAVAYKVQSTYDYQYMNAAFQELSMTKNEGLALEYLPFHRYSQSKGDLYVMYDEKSKKLYVLEISV